MNAVTWIDHHGITSADRGNPEQLIEMAMPGRPDLSFQLHIGGDSNTAASITTTVDK
jgi:hypothetical protein